MEKHPMAETHTEFSTLKFRTVALAGNPNVGKSTVFNALTGLNQHTGNWPGKTVVSASGTVHYNKQDYNIVDLPGTYSIMAHSAEEEVARDFILFGGADAVVVVCDATCLERNLNLVLQVMEITPNVIVCVNLLDEAAKRGINPNLEALAQELGVPVVGTTARSGEGLSALMEKVEAVCDGNTTANPKTIDYEKSLLEAASPLIDVLDERLKGKINSTWTAFRILEKDTVFSNGMYNFLGYNLAEEEAVKDTAKTAWDVLDELGITPEKLKDTIVSSIVKTAEKTACKIFPPDPNKCNGCTRNCQYTKNDRDRKIDNILTSKKTGIPIMLSLLCVIFWLTITGSNYPSQLLADGMFWIQDRLSELFFWIGTPEWVHGILVLGMFRVLAWVVSVMLPPMAIFFPMFTILEDLGYLPRVAFNLDYQFKKAKACGKQALTMCMGFGCNAAGVTGCRIIDSPRERLIAIITNNFVPCNGRFPALIAIISMFFVGTAGGFFNSVTSALILTGVIILGVLLTFWVSRLLSETILKGEPSSFTLELPPYRIPQFGKVIVRSIFDRTLFVLGRAIVVAAPAGLIIWLLANITLGDATLLSHCAGFLDPFARLLGLDGVILLAFILGFPANEIVVPIMIMAYMSTGTILELDSLTELKTLLIANGWTWVTAVSTMLFCLIHWPCSTTCLTIKKETGSMKWTLISILIPTVIGMAVCFIFATTARIFAAV